jgi:hypothetical protein
MWRQEDLGKDTMNALNRNRLDCPHKLNEKRKIIP